TLDEDTIVRSLLVLSDHRVRDALLVCPNGIAPAAAHRLWLLLSRAAPTSYRADPACLLGLSAYLQGNGALATAALDVASSADPAHTLAPLLAGAFDAAIRPAELEAMLRPLSTRALAELRTDAA
ncbi:MAG: DUF4192 family protein, partial [Sciscionella sp.]